ncbi:hypothetical protein J6590_027498 [Homalodisca vitripennis]|nr:hypothetical protein J6590_027498 [Homalodisca vitripennis]
MKWMAAATRGRQEEWRGCRQARDHSCSSTVADHSRNVANFVAPIMAPRIFLTNKFNEDITISRAHGAAGGLDLVTKTERDVPIEREVGLPSVGEAIHSNQRWTHVQPQKGQSLNPLQQVKFLSYLPCPKQGYKSRPARAQVA